MSTHPSYTRLLDAAKSLHNWTTAAEIARKLTEHGYKVSEQTMTNWKARGISNRAILKIAPILRVIPTWLETGDGPMQGMINTVSRSLAPPSPRLRPLCSLAEQLNDHGIEQLIGFATCLLATHRNIKKRAS